MNFQYLRKIWPWPSFTRRLLQRRRSFWQSFRILLSRLYSPLQKSMNISGTIFYLEKKPKKGAMSLISSFILFILSVFGLSLLYLSQIHLRMSAYKKNSTIFEYAAENGIKRGFNNLLELLSQASTPSILSSEHLDQLRENAWSNCPGIIEEILGVKLPLATSETWERQIWKSTTHFFLERIIEQENYFLALYRVSINSEGKIENFKQKRKSVLIASLGVFAGNLPLSFFPLLIDKQKSAEEKENFLEKNNISLFQSKKNHLQPKITFSEKELIPEEAIPELSKALKVNFFYPQNLSRAKLRAVLGLDESDEPVPDGVYLIKDDMGLGGVYAQGDVEEMVVAVENEFQVLFFRTKDGTWILKYSPSKSKTFFTTPEKTSHYDLIPLGIIIINGKVNSLGGGIVAPSGEVTMIKDREVSSILRGIQLTIISSDKITISSHLILQGVKQQEGLPYVKDSNSQLILFSTGKNFWDKTNTEGGITIEESSPAEIKIQAMLTARGEGFTIEGESKKIHILGSLQASDYISHKNSLKITFDDLWLEDITFPKNAPITKEPVIFISFFRALEWEEF